MRLEGRSGGRIGVVPAGVGGSLTTAHSPPYYGRAKTPMNRAYLAIQHPKVSHTFIRRRILELERQGHRIPRVPIRSPADAVFDPLNREEAGRTLVVLAHPAAT